MIPPNHNNHYNLRVRDKPTKTNHHYNLRSKPNNVPNHYDSQNIPTFKLTSIQQYGPPDAEKFDNYLVVDDVVDYSFDLKEWGIINKRKLRPIHRYSRVERFKGVLFNLMSLRGYVDEGVLELCEECVGWNDIRKILKLNGLRRFYNMIPLIFWRIHGRKWVDGDQKGKVVDNILHDFLIINGRFENDGFRKKWNRSYFPNLRFVAFKLMEMHSVFFEDTDYIRTDRKKKVLDSFWEDLVY